MKNLILILGALILTACATTKAQTGNGDASPRSHDIKNYEN